MQHKAPGNVWYNYVLSAPIIGVQLNAWTAFPRDVWAVLNALNGSWANRGSKIQPVDATNVHVELDDGVYFDLDPSGIVCGYHYPVALQYRPGYLPTHSTATLQPLDGLLDRLRENIEVVYSEFVKVAPRQVARIGVLAEHHIDPASVPPPVADLVAAIRSPWKFTLGFIDYHVTAVMQESPDWRRQCHIHVEQEEDRKLIVKFDWQELFRKPRSLRGPQFAEELDAVMVRARSYFGEPVMSGGEE